MIAAVLPLSEETVQEMPQPEKSWQQPTEPPELPARKAKIPSERDVEIYQQVVFAHRSQRDVARSFGLSQPRVNQILREIAAWMADNTPGLFTGLSGPQRLRLLHYNARKQLEYHQQSLMGAWHTSVDRDPEHPSGIKVPRRSFYHDVRYLREARKITTEILKLEGWKPGIVIPDPPQDSAYWDVPEDEEFADEEEQGEEGPLEEPAENHGLGAEESSAASLSRCSAEADETEKKIAEIKAVSAELRAACDEVRAGRERQQTQQRESEKRLSPAGISSANLSPESISLGSGPLAAEDVPRRRARVHEAARRQDFLAGDGQAERKGELLALMRSSPASTGA